MARTVKNEMTLLQALERVVESSRDSKMSKTFMNKAKQEIKYLAQLISDLCEQDAYELASKFDFSGGQIENVARKYSINSILHGDTGKPLEILLGFGKEEQLDTPHRHKIGF